MGKVGRLIFSLTVQEEKMNLEDTQALVTFKSWHSHECQWMFSDWTLYGKAHLKIHLLNWIAFKEFYNNFGNPWISDSPSLLSPTPMSQSSSFLLYVVTSQLPFIHAPFLLGTLSQTPYSAHPGPYETTTANIQEQGPDLTSRPLSTHPKSQRHPLLQRYHRMTIHTTGSLLLEDHGDSYPRFSQSIFFTQQPVGPLNV